MSTEEGHDERCWLNLSCHARAQIANHLGDAAEALADRVLETLGEMVAATATAWVLLPTPDLVTGSGADAAGVAPASSIRSDLVTVLGWVTWFSLGICVLSIILLGARMAIQSRSGEGTGHLGRLGVVLGAVVLISAASGIISALLPHATSVGVSGTVGWLQNRLLWFVGAAAMLSVIVGAARMAWEQRAEPGRELLKSLLTLVVVSSAGVATVGILVDAADTFAIWLLDEATDADFGAALVDLLALGTAVTGVATFSVLSVVVLGSIALFLCLIQLVMIIFRVGIIVVLVAVLPLAVSFTNTEMGRSWFKKICGWLVAFILYKPVAAIIYAAAFRLIATFTPGTDEDNGIVAMLAGMSLMLVALVAMPALIRLCVPAAGAIGSGGAGAALAGAGLGALPSGAMKLAEAAGKDSSGGGGGGSPSPTGAQQDGSSGQRPTTGNSSSGGGGGQGGPTGGKTHGGTGHQPSAAGGGQGGGPTPTGAGKAGAGTTAGGGGGVAGAGASSGAAGGASGAAGGAAAAHPAAAAASAAVQTAKAVGNVAKGAAEDSVGEGPSGSN